MTHTITFTPEETAMLDAAARASGQPLPDFLHSLVLGSLYTSANTPATGRDEAAVRRRMGEQWDAIDAEEDHTARVEVSALEKAAA